MNNLGTRLRLARERAGLSQIEVYKAINLNNKSLSRYENNISSPDPDTICSLAVLYNVSTDYLFGLSESIELTDATDIQAKLPPYEARLISIFRSLPPFEQGRLLERAEIVYDQISRMDSDTQ